MSVTVCVSAILAPFHPATTHDHLVFAQFDGESKVRDDAVAWGCCLCFWKRMNVAGGCTLQGVHMAGVSIAGGEH